tara:strand:+ start:3420 stop:3644 length:225 start_codon:yes stop_codon:yes gene_type:complete
MKDDYAFPRVTKLGEQAPGMELRDWFAGMALSGLVSKFWSDSHDYVSHMDYVEIAYILADEMIAVRNGKKNNDL